jgi:hypothetical protein
MKTLFAVLLLSLGGFAQQANLHSNFTAPYETQVFVPCADNGVGEMVDIAGTVHYVINSQTATGGFDVAGIGETTGEQYTAHLSGALTFHGIVFPITFHATSNIVLRSDTSQFRFQFSESGTMFSDGSTNVVLHDFKAICD